MSSTAVPLSSLLNTSLSHSAINTSTLLPFLHKPFFFSKPISRKRLVIQGELEGDRMTISSSVRVSERKLMVRDRIILSSVPENVVSSSAISAEKIEGVFLGARLADSGSRHVVPLGIFSDAPGKHDFKLLRKLVLPDGSILRARLPGRPTIDCLFTDPARDGVSLLKIWNMNKFTGVLGVYNCQGAAWSSIEKKNAFHHTSSAALPSSIRASDVHLISEAAADQNWNGDCAVFRHGKEELVVLPKNESLSLSLNVLEHEIFTVSPIQVLAPGFRFAPLGLLDMFNAGGAIDGLKYELLGGAARLLELDSRHMAPLNEALMQKTDCGNYDIGKVYMEVKGCGRLGAYSSAEPKKCWLGAEPVDFAYDASSGLVTLHLESMPEGDKNVHSVVVEL